MKRQLAIALGLAVVSTSALASKARLESLGQDAGGSQYIDDHRSVFLNPAHLNHHKDWATIEVGNTSSQAGTDQDGNATPRAEGGVFKSSGNMVYGLYFGDESNTGNQLRAGAMPTAAVAGDTWFQEQNSTTLFIAGDAGVQWGASIMHQAYEDEAAKEESSAMRARLGVISGNIDAFAIIALGSEAKDAAEEFEGTQGMDVGVTYDAGSDAVYMLRYQAIGGENKGGDKFEGTTTTVGAAKTYKLNDKARMWASAMYVMNKQSESYASKKDVESTSLPVTFSIEADANDWLAVRGFVGKNVFIGEDKDVNGKSTTVDGLRHGLGASLKYGDLSVDGSLILAGSGSDYTANGTQPGVLNLDEPMSRISVTYNF